MIDLNTLLGATPTIQVARQEFYADWDGAEIGRHNLRGTLVPSGAVVVGAVWATIVAITFDGAGTLALKLQNQAFVGPDLAAGVMVAEWGSNPYFSNVSSPAMLQAVVADAPLLTGLFTVWVVYLPDTTIGD